jgi:hypothetical protein
MFAIRVTHHPCRIKGLFKKCSFPPLLTDFPYQHEIKIKLTGQLPITKIKEMYAKLYLLSC